jgi:hypothetical protein
MVTGDHRDSPCFAAQSSVPRAPMESGAEALMADGAGLRKAGQLRLLFFAPVGYHIRAQFNGRFYYPDATP